MTEANQKQHPRKNDMIKRHMTENICTAPPSQTASDFIARMRSEKKRFDAFPYVYITDGHKRLKGAVSVQYILMAEETTTLESLMQKELVTVRPHTDRERVAMLAIHHKLKAIPVIDQDNILLGAISENSINEILHEEHVEDMLRRAGIHHTGESYVDILKARTSVILKARLPWLLFGLLGGMVATFVMRFFESSLEKQIGLAFFIPFILYMGAAVGVQSEIIFMRSELLGPVDIKRYILRELHIGPVIGLFTGSIASIFAFALFRNLALSYTIAISMFITATASVMVGVLIPFLLIKTKRDPAMGSGPFATIVQDLLSLAIYFSVATWIIG